VRDAVNDTSVEWAPFPFLGVNGCIIGSMIRFDTIQITPEFLSLIARIDEFKGAWRSLGTLAPECLSALRRVATIESVGSSTRALSGCIIQCIIQIR